MTASSMLRPLHQPLPWLVGFVCLLGVVLSAAAEPPVEAPPAPPARPIPDQPIPDQAIPGKPVPPADSAQPPKPAETPTPTVDPMVIGTFALAPDAVVDGDTVRVIGRKKSVRVLGVDTEETFKRERHRKAAELNFAAYAKEMRGESARPVKYGTPAGDAARTYVMTLMKGVTHVRLERDRAGGRDLDPFGRTLAFVIVTRPEGEMNLSESLIRAGHSPYFVKYGRSARFHKLFTSAEKEAREAARGIWASDGPAHYPDYAERLPWWHARDKQVQAWMAVSSEPNHITLGTDRAEQQLRELVGKQVTVFGSLERLIETDSSERKIMYLSHRRKKSFPLVAFTKTVVDGLDMPAIRSMFIKATGTISLYRKRPQIVVADPAQVVTK